MNKNALTLPSKVAWLGYVSIMISSAGFYGYYLNHPDALPHLWLVWGLVGTTIVVYKNCKLKKWRCWLLDFFNILCMGLMPMIPLPFGFSILGMAVICSILMAVSMKLAGYYPTKNTE